MHKNKILQSGRSMVEMLGTLAIMGILSIGGIAGYNYGINKYRANTIINDIMLRATDAIAQFDATGDANLSEWPTITAGQYTIGLEDDTIGIQIDGLPKDLCQMVFDNMINNAMIKVGTTEYDAPSDDICGDNNTMVFYVNSPEETEEEGEICGIAVDTGIGGCYPCSYPHTIMVLPMASNHDSCVACNRTFSAGPSSIQYVQCSPKK